MADLEEGIYVDDLISAVKEAVRLAGVSKATPNGDLRVASIQLVLRTVAARSAGGKLEFRVPVIGMALKAGSKVSRHDTHTVDMTLVPPTLPVKAVRGSERVQDALVDAVRTIRAAMISAAAGDDPWVVSGGTVDIEFAVTRQGTISLGAEGELSDDVRHTLRLRLEPGAAELQPAAMVPPARAPADTRPPLASAADE